MIRTFMFSFLTIVSSVSMAAVGALCTGGVPPLTICKSSIKTPSAPTEMVVCQARDKTTIVMDFGLQVVTEAVISGPDTEAKGATRYTPASRNEPQFALVLMPTAKPNDFGSKFLGSLFQLQNQSGPMNGMIGVFACN
jgi:hypothetical protein